VPGSARCAFPPTAAVVATAATMAAASMNLIRPSCDMDNLSLIAMSVRGQLSAKPWCDHLPVARPKSVSSRRGPRKKMLNRIAAADARRRRGHHWACRSGPCRQGAGPVEILFPAATSFSAKEGKPGVFKAYVGDPKTKSQTGAGYIGYTTDWQPFERGYDGPIKILVGLDTTGFLTNIIRRLAQGNRTDTARLTRQRLPISSTGKSIQDAFKLRADVDAGVGATASVGRRHAVDPRHRQAHGRGVFAARRGETMTESWGEILEPQWLDLVLLTAFFALALFSFFRKSVVLKYVTMAVAVAYLGLAKSNLVSVVDIFRFSPGTCRTSSTPSRGTSSWGSRSSRRVLWGPRVLAARICAVRRVDASSWIGLFLRSFGSMCRFGSRRDQPGGNTVCSPRWWPITSSRAT